MRQCTHAKGAVGLIGKNQASENNGIDARNVTPSTRLYVVAGTLFLLVLALLLCLIPQRNLDFFWQLRTGDDILRTGRVPHVDTYSWTNRGTPWCVPEWLSFVVYSLAFKAGGTLATWLLMTACTLALAVLLWWWLLKTVRPSTALLLASLAILTLFMFVQERPYCFTYLLLALSMMVVVRARDGHTRHLQLLLPITALWANLHQAVVVLIGILATVTAGDLAGAMVDRLRRRADAATGRLRSAGVFAAATTGCAIAAMASPYGWQLYKNVWETLRDPVAMEHVVEWQPVWHFTVVQFPGFYPLIALIAFGWLRPSGPRDLGAIFATLTLLFQALMHSRNVPLFGITAVVLAARDVDSALAAYSAPLPRWAGRLGGLFAAVAVVTILGLFVRSTRQGVGDNLQSTGDAAIGLGWFPSRAVDFVQSEGFPAGLRLFNDYNIGGYLIYRLPSEPVFMDGRNDVYAGATLRAYSHAATPDGTASLTREYDLDCVMTTVEQQAHSFYDTPGWTLVYVDPPTDGSTAQCFIFLRDRPSFLPLINRCRHDSGLPVVHG